MDTVTNPRVTVGRWVLTATVLASAMDFTSQSAVNVALPAIQSALQASGAQLIWIVTSHRIRGVVDLPAPDRMNWPSR